MLVIGFGAVGFAGGLWSTPSAEPTVQAFLLAWQQHQYRAAAELTTGKPEVVATALQDAYLQLDAAAFFVAMGPISQHGNTAHAAFSASVDLGQDGPPGTTAAALDLRQTGSGWKVVWSPSVINPGLRPGLRLAVVSSTPRRALLEDASGVSLQSAVDRVRGRGPARPPHPTRRSPRPGSAGSPSLTPLSCWASSWPRRDLPSRSWWCSARPSTAGWPAGLARVPGLIIKPEQLRLFSSIAPAVVGSVGTETSSTLRDQGIAYRPGATVGLSGLQEVYQRAAGLHRATPRWSTETAPVVVAVLQKMARAGTHPGADHDRRRPADRGRPAWPALGERPQRRRPGIDRAHPDRGAAHRLPPAARSTRWTWYQPGPAFTIVSTAALLAAA